MILTILLLHLLLPGNAQLSLPNPPIQPQSPDAQRSGNLPSSNRVSWRNSSALGDVPPGGYYDAGDYVKFTYPLTYTLTSICWGAIDFGKGYDLANQTAYLDSMLRWGLDWLIAAHPDNNTLIVQVGDPSIDNNYWGGDQNIPTPRPSYQIDSGQCSSPSIGGIFCLLFPLFFPYSLPNEYSDTSSPASLTNTTYASTLLSHAVELFTFANSTLPLQTYQTAVPQAASSYASSGYTDELVLAGLFLAAALNSTEYHTAALSLYRNASLANGNGALNWDSKTPALAVLGLQVSSAVAPDAVGTWQAEAERYLDNVVDNKSNGRLTKGHPKDITCAWIIVLPGDSDSASLNPALNIAMLMLHYAPMATTKTKTSSYETFAASQLAYTLGSNPMSAPYINPHTALASGGTDIGAIDTSPPTEAHVLYGAVVGGPDKNDRFWDIRSDYPQTEVALDYNAPILTLVAANVLSNSADPFYTRLTAGVYASKRPSGKPCDAAFPCGHHGLSLGGKIAIGVLVPIAVLAIGLAAWVVSRRSRRKRV
ncbi:glycoside hydrolase family 9 protein [Hydnum rufescens UP504]|uniref:Endoglucanase n=1 Tax=Hydnum rufescens UP504 TaxID=1448309 RepID=A0A9P6B1X2_9AGAM|nr:glycoside hydrolase family 9 protein [Hydnum rufescens UP504]